MGEKCWVAENVNPYYDYLIPPTNELHRHSFWSNFYMASKAYPKMETCKKKQEREFLSKELGFDLGEFSGIDKRKVLRNCVLPALGLHILEESKKNMYQELFSSKVTR
jgi:hypothetical protein